MLRKILLTLALGAGLLSLAPMPAQADSFSFSYGSGGGRHGGWHHGGPRWHGGYRHHWGPRPYYRPYYYDPYPPVIYEEPIIVQPAPRVVEYQEPPVSLAPEPPRNDGTCREYQTRIKIDGKWQNAYGTTCRQPDGSWQNVD